MYHSKKIRIYTPVRLRSILLMIGLSWQVMAMAQYGFVHIQSENGQPFYVQWNGDTYGSSATGYVVIPKITAGEQSMVIGFPRNQYPEYIFTFPVNDKPRGFSLKLGVDNSWSLFDMVNFTLLKGKQVTQGEKSALEKEAERLAKLNKPVDSLENVFKPVETKSSSGISKIFEKTTDEGTDLVYVVNNNGKTDTVVIFIPATKPPQPKPAATGRSKAVGNAEASLVVIATSRALISDRFPKYILSK